MFNSKVLSICGIDEKTKDPNGGKIIRDENGFPTGIFIDNAIDYERDFNFDYFAYKTLYRALESLALPKHH